MRKINSIKKNMLFKSKTAAIVAGLVGFTMAFSLVAVPSASADATSDLIAS
jgi:hypothetical protein